MHNQHCICHCCERSSTNNIVVDDMGSDTLFDIMKPPSGEEATREASKLDVSHDENSVVADLCDLAYTASPPDDRHAGLRAQSARERSLAWCLLSVAGAMSVE